MTILWLKHSASFYQPKSNSKTFILKVYLFHCLVNMMNIRLCYRMRPLAKNGNPPYRPEFRYNQTEWEEFETLPGVECWQ